MEQYRGLNEKCNDLDSFYTRISPAKPGSNRTYDRGVNNYLYYLGAGGSLL